MGCDDSIEGLSDLIAELRLADQVAGIRLVGGAALALAYFEVTRADALPTLGRVVEWEAIYDQGGVLIQVASKEALLAMKLRANRPGRNTRDTRLLLSLCHMDTHEECEDFYEEFYPEDGLDPRAVSIVKAILAGGPDPGARVAGADCALINS